MASAGPILPTMKNGKGKKLCRNIKIGGGPIFVDCHFPKKQNVFISMFFETRGNAKGPHKLIILDFGSTKLLNAIQQLSRTILVNIKMIKLKYKKSTTLKRRVPKTP